MMELIEVLPTNLIHCILIEWINDIRDILSFDTALCNRTDRNIYLQLPRKRLPPITIVNTQKSLSHVIHWKQTRNYEMTHLSLTYPYSMEEGMQIRWIELKEATSLKLMLDSRLDPELMFNQFNNDMMEPHFTIDINAILIAMPYLQSIAITQTEGVLGCKFIGNQTLKLRKMNTKFALTTFRLNNIKILNDHSDSFLDFCAWLQHCNDHLSEVLFEDCMCENENYIIQIYNTFPHLRSFAFQNNHLADLFNTHNSSATKTNAMEHSQLRSLTLSDFESLRVFSQILLSCKSLNSLIVENMAFDDDGDAWIDEMAELTQLEKLTIRECQCNDMFFELVFNCCQQIKELEISKLYDSVSNDLMEILVGLSGLTSLTLVEVDVTDEGIVYFCENIADKAQLKSLSIGSLSLSVESYQKIFESFRLEYLSIDRTAAYDSRFDEQDIEILRELAKYSTTHNGKKLKTLVFEGGADFFSEDHQFDSEKINPYMIELNSCHWEFPHLRTVCFVATVLNDSMINILFQNCPKLLTIRLKRCFLMTGGNNAVEYFAYAEYESHRGLKDNATLRFKTLEEFTAAQDSGKYTFSE